MLQFTYKCNSCQHKFGVIEMNFEVFVEPNYEPCYKSHKDLKCPKCNSSDVACTWDESTDAWQDEVYDNIEIER